MNQIVSKIPTVLRILFGLVFFVFGLNGFLNFMPQPPQPEEAGKFLGALAATGYMFPMIKGVEVLAGAMLLANRFVPLALILLAPIVVNIVGFHTVLAPDLVMPIVLVAIHVYLAWSYRGAFRGVLAARTELTTSKAAA